MQIEYCISLIRSIYKFFLVLNIQHLGAKGGNYASICEALKRKAWACVRLEGRLIMKGNINWKGKTNHIFRTFRSWISTCICCHVWIRVHCLSLFLFVCLSLCLSVCLSFSVRLFVRLHFSVSLSLSLYPIITISLSVCISITLISYYFVILLSVLLFWKYTRKKNI